LAYVRTLLFFVFCILFFLFFFSCIFFLFVFCFLCSLPPIIFRQTSITSSLRQYPRLSSLRQLGLRGNVMLDSVLSDLAPMTQLLSLDLGDAQLRAGAMFDFKGFDQLAMLHLGNVAVYGELPALDLPALTDLDIQATALYGPLPPLRLPQLSQVYLSLTKLTGSIHAFDNCTRLSYFGLQMSGGISVDLRGLCTRWPLLTSISAMSVRHRTGPRRAHNTRTACTHSSGAGGSFSPLATVVLHSCAWPGTWRRCWAPCPTSPTAPTCSR
jgi:hypothetical protein